MSALALFIPVVTDSGATEDKARVVLFCVYMGKDLL